MKETVLRNPPTGGGGTSFSMQYQFDALGAAGLLCGTVFHEYTPYEDDPEDVGFYNAANAALGALVAFSCALVVPPTSLFAAALGSLAATSTVTLSSNRKGNASGRFQLPVETAISAVVGASSQAAPRPSVEPQAAGQAIVNYAASSFVRPPVVPGLTYGSSNGVAIIPEAAVPLGAGPSAVGYGKTKKFYKPVQDMLKEYGITLIPVPFNMYIGVGNDSMIVLLDTNLGTLTVNGVSAPVEKILDTYSMTPDAFNELMKNAGVEKISQGQVTKEQLEEFGWKNTDDEFVNRFNNSLIRYGITDRASITMFMASMAAESNWGQHTLELPADRQAFIRRINESKGTSHPIEYTVNERGAGYLQITWFDTQNTFLQTIPEEAGKDFTGTDTASYIANNYPMEASMWFWANAAKSGEGTLNKYVEKHGIGMGPFIVTQYFLNSTFDMEMQPLMEQIRDGKLILHKDFEFVKHTDGKSVYYTLEVMNGQYKGSYNAPQGWNEREDAYNKALEAFYNNK